MQELIKVTGIVLKASPVGDYDRRILILTKELGKITAFARGARRPSSRLLAATSPFVFGEFVVYPGRSAYSLKEVEVGNYFEGLRDDMYGTCYGMFFLEVMDYYTRENNEEKQMLMLLYQSLRALQLTSLDKELVRCIFEIKALMLNGEYPGLPSGTNWKESTVYAVHYIQTSNIEKLYTFTVTEDILHQLQQLTACFRKCCMDREMKSLEVLEALLV